MRLRAFPYCPAKFLIGVFLLLLALLPQPTQATITSKTYFLSYPTQGENWHILTTENISAGSEYKEFLGIGDVEWAEYGIRAYKTDSDGNVISEITNGSQVAIVRQEMYGNGLLSNIWSCTQTAWSNSNRLKIEVWIRTNLLDWFDSAICGGHGVSSVYLTSLLNATSLLNSEWTVYYWTDLTVLDYVAFWWEVDNEESRIENIQFDDGVTEESVTSMVPFFFLGIIMMLPIGLLIAKKH